MNTVRVKTVLDSGYYAVFDVAPRHLPHDRAIRYYGELVATKFSSGWWSKFFNGPVTPEAAVAFEKLPVTVCSCYRCGLVPR